jgi:hypothetical protein
LTASVVTQVARFESIGQLPSGRTECSMNATPRSITRSADSQSRDRLGAGASPIPSWSRFCRIDASAITTKLVSGIASRKPPLDG